MTQQGLSEQPAHFCSHFSHSSGLSGATCRRKDLFCRRFQRDLNPSYRGRPGGGTLYLWQWEDVESRISEGAGARDGAAVFKKLPPPTRPPPQLKTLPPAGKQVEGQKTVGRRQTLTVAVSSRLSRRERKIRLRGLRDGPASKNTCQQAR